MTADIDPAFADRCAAAALSLTQLAELGARPDTDADAPMAAGSLTAALLADPEALLAVALVIEQQRAGMLTPGDGEPCTETYGDDDPIRCEVRGPHDVHRGRVSWGGL